MTILDPTESYTFSKYFEMHISLQDFAEEFGYTFTRTRLNWQENPQKLILSVQLPLTKYGNFPKNLPN
jgi:hypothetical protein